MTRRPLFVPTVVFAFGCWVSLAGFAAPWAVLLLLALSLAAGILGRRVEWGAAVFVLALLGMAYAALRAPPAPGAELVALASRRPVEVTATVLSDPERSFDRLSFRAEVEAVVRWRRLHRPGGLVQVSLYQGAARIGVRYGDRLRLRGRLSPPQGPRNPGDFSYRDYLARQGIGAILRVFDEQDVTYLGSRPRSRFTSAVLAAKARARRGLMGTLEPKTAGLVDGLVFSSIPSLDPERVEEFQATGTVHLLSTSGAHLAALVFALSWLLGRARRRYRRPAAGLLILFLVAYCIAAGARSAVLRATVMGCFWAAAPLFDRDSDVANGFFGALLVLLALNPADLRDLGFQLSTAAVGALLLLAHPLSDALSAVVETPDRASGSRRMSVSRATSRLFAWGAAGLGVALAAEVGVAPLVAYHFWQISLVAPLANLVVVPVAMPAVVLGLLHGVTTALWPPLGWLTGTLLDGLCYWLQTLVQGFAALPMAAVPCAPPPSFVIALFYLSVFLLCRPWRLAYEPRG